jgi:hypothetical protein
MLSVFVTESGEVDGDMADGVSLGSEVFVGSGVGVAEDKFGVSVAVGTTDVTQCATLLQRVRRINHPNQEVFAPTVD